MGHSDPRTEQPAFIFCFVLFSFLCLPLTLDSGEVFFSVCSQVERKNYDQRCEYFTATSRDGSKVRTSVTRQVTMLY